MAISIGTAVGYLDLDTSKFDTAFSQAGKDMEDFDKKAKELGDGMDGVGEKTTTVKDKFASLGKDLTSTGTKLTAGVTVPLVGLATTAVKTGMDFDSAMSKVSAISGAAGDDLQSLRDKAKEMGASTKFSATEAAEAFQYMAMAGWDTEAMLAGIDGIMALSAADGLDLASTSDIVTDALTAFGLSAEDSGHFADILAKASSSANTNVSMLGESFKYVAPLAGTLGYSAEDTSIALGLMANAGIKGSQAGTSLKTALANLASPTKNMVGVMNEYDISLTNTDGSMKSLKELMDDLRDKMAVTTDAEAEANYQRAYENALLEGSVALSAEEVKALGEQGDTQKKYAAAVATGSNALETMNEKEYRAYVLAETGKDIKEEQLTQEEQLALAYQKGVEVLGDNSAAQQAAAASTLFGKEAMAGMLNIINASDEDYQKLTEEIYNCDGAAQEMADTMQDNLEGKMTTLKSAVEGLQISFSEFLIPTLTKVVEKITEVVNWFNSLDDDTKRTIITVAGFAAALGPVLVILGTLASSISSLIGLAETVTAAFGVGGVAGALGALINPVGAIIAAIALLAAAWATDFGRIQEVTGEALRSIQLLVGPIIEDIVGMFTEGGGDISQSMADLWNSLERLFHDALVLIKDTVLKFLIDVRQKWDSDWMGIRSVTEQVIGMIKTLFQGFVQALSSLFKAFSALFRGDWEGFWNNIKAFFNTVWTTIGDLLAGFLKAMVSAVLGIGVSLYEAAVNVFNELKRGFDETWSAIREWFESVKEDPVGAILSISEKMADAGKAIIDALLGGLKAAWEAVTQWFADIGSWVIDKVNSIKDSLSEAKDAAESIERVSSSSGSTRTINRGSNYHRSGLDYVPYDGYVATLHTGERVLTQEEAAGYTGGRCNTFNFYGTPPLDEYETARQFKLAQRQIAMG